MKYQIDQSGKIENTSKDTILCISNDSWDALVIKAKTKRQLQEIFRRNGQIRNYILFTFSIGLALLIKRNSNMNTVLIDHEYLGREAIIKNIILETLKDQAIVPEISFGFIGKSSPAHDKAAKIAHKKLKAKKNLTLKDILGELKKTEVGKRLKNA